VSGAARAGLATVAVVLALGASGCVTVSTPASAPATAPSRPMMGQGGTASGDADDGYGDPGGMMGGTTAAPAVPHSGPVAGEALTPAAVLTLQREVDHGAQPWRLDPQMTAVGFTRARFAWMMPRTERTATDTVVVDDGAGGTVSLRLVQPGRTGPDGVWTVAGGTWLR
jgi:hypothetical protein